MRELERIKKERSEEAAKKVRVYLLLLFCFFCACTERSDGWPVCPKGDEFILFNVHLPPGF
jgi:hypothetical protein